MDDRRWEKIFLDVYLTIEKVIRKFESKIERFMGCQERGGGIQGPQLCLSKEGKGEQAKLLEHWGKLL